MLQQMLNRYKITNDEDYRNALREIFQEITLAGLYRGGFFEKAAFYGGTALRILYGLPRFSEDLDFTLLQKNSDFDIEQYRLTDAIENGGLFGIRFGRGKGKTTIITHPLTQNPKKF